MVMSGKQANTKASVKGADTSTRQDAGLQEGRDYYLEDGLFVFTAAFLLKRGYCCESGCRHCPYQNRERTGVPGAAAALGWW
jgi:hypothetical protein